MKTTTLPPVRVEPELRQEIERVLRPNESTSAFVEAAVRSEVKRRELQAEFFGRGLAAQAESEQLESWITDEDMVRELRERGRRKPPRRGGVSRGRRP